MRSRKLPNIARSVKETRRPLVIELFRQLGVAQGYESLGRIPAAAQACFTPIGVATRPGTRLK